jgi:hypothetical protein
MTELQYNSLLPHKLIVDAMYDCLDKGLQLPSAPSFLINTMIDIKDNVTGQKPTDKSCGACVTEAVKDTLRMYKAYENK